MTHNLKYVITKGYIKIPFRELDEKGKVIKEHQGGFVEDWNKGRLWVLIDIEKHEVVDGSFNPSKLLKKAVKYATERSK